MSSCAQLLPELRDERIQIHILDRRLNAPVPNIASAPLRRPDPTSELPAKIGYFMKDEPQRRGQMFEYGKAFARILREDRSGAIPVLNNWGGNYVGEVIALQHPCLVMRTEYVLPGMFENMDDPSDANVYVMLQNKRHAMDTDRNDPRLLATARFRIADANRKGWRFDAQAAVSASRREFTSGTMIPFAPASRTCFACTGSHECRRARISHCVPLAANTSSFIERFPLSSAMFTGTLAEALAR